MPERSSRRSSGVGSRQRARHGRSLLGLVRIEKVARSQNRRGRYRFRFHWGRIAATLLVLTAVGWVSTAGALTLYFREIRDYREASWGEMMVLPFRLDEHRREMGEFFVEEGIASAEEGDFRSAFHQLRIGLARAPAHPAGRRLLAEIYAQGLRDNGLALEVLVGGLEHREEHPGFLARDYLQPLFQLLAIQREDEERIRLAGELGDEVGDEATAIFLASEAVRAEIALGRYGPARQRLRESGLRNTLPGILALAELQELRGEDERALAILQQAADRYPGREDLGRALLRISRETGRWDELLDYARYQQILSPDQAGPRVLELYALEGRGDDLLASERAAGLLAERGDEAPVQLELLRFAADSRRADLAARVVERGKALGTHAPHHTLLLALSQIRAGEYAAALDLLEPDPGKGEEDLRATLDPARVAVLTAVARIGLEQTEAARGALSRFYQQPSPPPELFVTLANLLTEAGADTLAYEVLQEGAERFPGQPDLLAGLLQRDEEEQRSSSYLRHAEAILEGRTPGSELLHRLREVLGSDRFLLDPGREGVVARIDQLLSEAEIPSSLVSLGPVEAPETTPQPRETGTTPLGLPRIRPGVLPE